MHWVLVGGGHTTYDFHRQWLTDFSNTIIWVRAGADRLVAIQLQLPAAVIQYALED